MGPPQDWREAAEAAFAGLSGYIHELNTDVGLYRAVRRTMDDAKVVVGRCIGYKSDPDPPPSCHNPNPDPKQPQAGLTEEERRTAQLLKAEFESSGIHLPAAEREGVRALLNEVTALETEFSSNLIMRRTGFQVRCTKRADSRHRILIQHDPFF